MKEKKYIEEVDLLNSWQINIKSKNNHYLNDTILDLANQLCLEIETKNDQDIFKKMDKECAMLLLYKASLLPFDDVRKLLPEVPEIKSAEISEESLIRWFEVLAIRVSAISLNRLTINWYQTAEPFKHLLVGKFVTKPKLLDIVDKEKCYITDLNDQNLSDALTEIHLLCGRWLTDYLIRSDKDFEVLKKLDESEKDLFCKEACKLVDDYRKYLSEFQSSDREKLTQKNINLELYNGFFESLNSLQIGEEKNKSVDLIGNKNDKEPNPFVYKPKMVAVKSSCCVIM